MPTGMPLEKLAESRKIVIVDAAGGLILKAAFTQYCKSMGINRTQLAEQAGTTSRRISDLVKGYRFPIPIEALERLCEITNIRWEELEGHISEYKPTFAMERRQENQRERYR